MLEAYVKIDDELVVKGFRKALRFKAVKDISVYFASLFAIVWIVIAFADAVMGQADLIRFHFLFLFGLWVVASVVGYVEWYVKLSKTKGWDFYAKIDDESVITSTSQENRNNWNLYKSYEEFEDYLQINGHQGEITFLPKTPELFEIIELTKQKISVK